MLCRMYLVLLNCNFLMFAILQMKSVQNEMEKQLGTKTSIMLKNEVS